jgi:hypothetical protein
MRFRTAYLRRINDFGSQIAYIDNCVRHYLMLETRAKEEMTMAIKREKQEGDKLVLTLDNGDMEKFEQVMNEWSFKDEQSFLRFAMSIFLVTEGKSLWIQQKGMLEQIEPATDLRK